MSHQPYETWLLSEDDLNKDQETELKAHLAECQQCRSLATAWGTVRETLVTTPTPSHTSGFTHRWHARLAIHQQQRQQRRMVWLTFGLFAVASLILTTLALASIMSASFSFAFSQFIAKLSLAALQISQLTKFIGDFIQVSPFTIPILIVSGSGALLAMAALIVAWLSVMIRLHQPATQGVRTS